MRNVVDVVLGFVRECDKERDVERCRKVTADYMVGSVRVVSWKCYCRWLQVHHFVCESRVLRKVLTISPFDLKTIGRETVKYQRQMNKRKL